MSALVEALSASFWKAFGDDDPDPMGAYADEETGVVDGRLPIGLFITMAAALPPPVEPVCPPLEDVQIIADLAHDWDEDDYWDGDRCGGCRCRRCGEMSECTSCTPLAAQNEGDCARGEAEVRNSNIRFAYAKLAAVYEAQLAYYRQLLAEVPF